LDSQAVVALLIGEPAAPEVAELLRDPAQPVSISAVNVAEVVDVLVRVMGRRRDEVIEKLDWLAAGGLRVVSLDEDIGRAAGGIHATRYHRRERPLSLADGVALATALARGESIATSDPALAVTATEEGVDVIWLPDSQGRRPG
jgi:PIN domain nuclease of toxin-antitoxin system